MSEVEIPDDSELVRRVIASLSPEPDRHFPLWEKVAIQFDMWDYEADRPDEKMGRALCLRHGFDP